MRGAWLRVFCCVLSAGTWLLAESLPSTTHYALRTTHPALRPEPNAIVGHLQSGIRRDDLWKIADHLEASRAALVVVYDPSMAEHVARKITASIHFISKVRDLRAELARG